MKAVTGWTDYKELARENKVSYSTYCRRVKQGLSPLEAASITPLTPHEIMINSLKQGIIKPTMTREGTQIYDSK